MNWPTVQLGGVVQIDIGYAFDSKQFNSDGMGMPVVRIRDVKRGFTQTHFNGEFSDRFIVRDGDILIGMDGDFNCQKWRGGTALLNQRVCRVKSASAKLDSRFLFFALPSVLHQIWKVTPFVTVKHLSRKSLSEATIALPPLEEQKRISRALNTSEKGICDSERLSRQLDSLRDAAIRVYVESAADKESLNDLADLQGGLSLSAKRATHPIQVGYLRVANVQRNQILLDQVKSIRCTVSEVERCSLSPGDILMLEANANPAEVGRSAVLSEMDEKLVFQNHLFRVRSKSLEPVVLNALLSSTPVRAQLLRLAKTTSGLNTMTINHARGLKIPIGEERATQRLYNVLNRIDRLQKLLDQKICLCGQLAKALETRAFAGLL